METYRRQDLSDTLWNTLEPHLPGGEGHVGRPATDNRLFLDAFFWIPRTGAPWRDLPPDLGDWKNVRRRFCRWRDSGLWEKLLEILIDEPDYKWIIFDTTHCKVHPHAAGTES